ncbi:MAG: T9SS type A sorting domain-containing protein [Paludibacter sp.]|nr:T9SS type A sorting domain-containing protein [Paludibacter sp.]
MPKNCIKILYYYDLEVSNKEIDMSGLPAGMYIITLQAGGKTYSDKIIIQK